MTATAMLQVTQEYLHGCWRDNHSFSHDTQNERGCALVTLKACTTRAFTSDRISGLRFQPDTAGLRRQFRTTFSESHRVKKKFESKQFSQRDPPSIGLSITRFSPLSVSRVSSACWVSPSQNAEWADNNRFFLHCL